MLIIQWGMFVAMQRFPHGIVYTDMFLLDCYLLAIRIILFGYVYTDLFVGHTAISIYRIHCADVYITIFQVIRIFLAIRILLAIRRCSGYADIVWLYGHVLTIQIADY